MDSEKIKSLLAQHDIDLDVIHYPATDSTNTKAAKLLQNGCKRDSLLVAEKQTGGKGRMGRSWQSNNTKGIWASLALAQCQNPQMAIRSISISIMEEMAKHGAKDISIKWPNDILIGEKKVCGLLAEKVESSEMPDGLVLGFGININQTKQDFPPDLRETATSLKWATGKEWSRTEILTNVIKNFFSYINGSAENVFAKYKNALSSIGRKCMLDDRKIFAESITEDGGLVIINEKNQRETVYSGTLRYV